MKLSRILIVGVLCALAFAGCGKKEESAPAAPVTSTSTEAAPVAEPTAGTPTIEQPVTDATKTGVQDVRPDAAGQR